MLGAVMPKHVGLTRELAEKTEDFVLTFLLPVFFAYSGLRTQIGLLNRPKLWLLCALIVVIAIAGKYFGAYIAARVGGINNREASALGWLMNTRGLTELIVLNIGLSLNVISPLLFTMLVIMALVTTFMTSPLLELVYPKRLAQQDRVEPLEQGEPAYRVLVPLANPDTQQGLIRLALAIASGNASSTAETPLPPAAVYPVSLIQIEEESFESTPAEVDRRITLQQNQINELVQTLPPTQQAFIQPIVRVATNVADEISRLAEQEQADLVLIGWHRPTFRTNRLGGRVGQVLSKVRADVAVFVDRQPQQLQELLVPYIPNNHNDLGLEIALRLLVNCQDCQLTVLRVAQPDRITSELTHEFRTLLDQLPQSVKDRIQVPVVTDNPIQAVVKASAGVDLTIVGASREWGLERQTLGRYTDALVTGCQSSLLITRKRPTTPHLASILTKTGSATTPVATGDRS